nr:AAA family ATPase [Bacteroidota bacterium]
MRIYLVGYMGAGKSTIGKSLARIINFSNIDLDVVFETTYKISIMDFFKKYDESAFRSIEHQLLKNTFDLENHIISTGGGTPCFYNNMELINRNGISVYVKMHPKSLYTRLSNSRRERPITAELDDEKLMERINSDLIVREQFYNTAQFQIKGEDINLQSFAEILWPHLHPS